MRDLDLVEALLNIAETGQLNQATETMARSIDGCVGLHCTFMSASGAREQMTYALTPEVVGERLKTDFQTADDNPMIASGHRLPMGRLTMVERYVDMDAYLASELYQEMIEPYDTPYISTIVLPGRHGLVSFGLGQRDGMTEHSLQRAEVMAFNVARAFDLYVGTQAPGRGAFLIDPAGCLVGQSDVSISRLTDGVLRLSSIGGPVRPAINAIVPIFQRTLSYVTETGQAARLTCPNEKGVPYVVTISAGPALGPHKVLWVNSERSQRLHWSLDELQAVYRLTGREASVVVAILGGASIATAADDLGLSERSVRTYLSNVFGKMGVTSQVQLLQHLLGPE